MSRYAIMNQENGYVHGPFEATNYLAARQAFADKYGHKDYEELVEKDGENHYICFELATDFTVKDGQLVPFTMNARVVEWASARNLIHGSDPKSQTVKLGEEFGELCAAIARGKTHEAIDAIGDMTVVLTILAAQLGTSFVACQDEAWEQIKDRKGRMVDGVFVKENE